VRLRFEESLACDGRIDKPDLGQVFHHFPAKVCLNARADEVIE